MKGFYNAPKIITFTILKLGMEVRHNLKVA